MLTAGCGSGSSGTFAGMSEYDARGDATRLAADERRTPRSPFYNREANLTEIEQGTNSAGDPAWVAHFALLPGNEPICVRLWTRATPLRETVTYEVDDCTLEGETSTQEEAPA